MRRKRALVATLALTFLSCVPGGATTYKILHTFRGSDGDGPWGGVIMDSKGNLLGTTASGGDPNSCNGYGCGVVFRLESQRNGKWMETILYNFRGYPDGDGSYSNLILDAFGNLYGSTYYGGIYDSGTVFELARGRNGLAESILYNFGTNLGDGGKPAAGVIMDSAGNLYGTAQTITFELTPGSGGWKENILHRFIKRGDGGAVFAGVILDAGGTLYGTTEGGGAYNGGTVYEVKHTKTGWKESILHSFGSFAKDGQKPGWGTLLMDSDGNLYGTTAQGGANYCNAGCGTVFRLTKDKNDQWAETILYNFQKGDTGFSPNAGVVMDKAGNLYGTTDYGGDPYCGCGVIYKLAPAAKGKWTYTVLHEFGIGGDGGVPEGNLVIDSKGNLYGGTVLGGTYGGGVIFEITP